MKRVVRATVAAVVFVVAVAIGASNFIGELKAAFRDAPLRMISPRMQDQIKIVKSMLPPGAPLFYFGNHNPPDYWGSRLWQRAFYPTRVSIVEHDELSRWPSLEALEAAYSANYALSVGDPPDDPGFSWHIVLSSEPGHPAIWFGELRH